MIKTSRQLKALVRNLTKGDSLQAQIIMRNYVMERFLERISLSKYRNNFILKGGMLVSAMVGLDTRSTMDIDTTIKNMPLSVENAKEMIEEIIAIPIDDGMTFSIKSVGEIMDEAEYSGVRANLEATLETMRTPLKVDISTGDIITPREVLYTFRLMFEERTISILAYNLETVLAEKMETVIARGVANTRLRDYYDLYILQNEYTHAMNMEQFKAAFLATSKKRNSIQLITEGNRILKEIADSEVMQGLWKSYQKKFSYAEDISWEMVMDSIEKLGIGWNVLLPLILFSLVFLYVSGVVQRARYRISINKINIHNRFKQYSYLDIMLNPAGGMPFMYAMSLVSIPQYVFMLIQFIHPENKWTSGAIKALTVGQPLWLVVYLVMLFVLGLAFAFVNVSGEQISERMRKSGEYIYGVYPGQETSAYINHLVLRLGFIGALYMLFMAGAPMLIILVNPDYLQLSMIPGTFLIFSGMIYNVNEEMKALKLNTSYTPLFENV